MDITDITRLDLSVDTITRLDIGPEINPVLLEDISNLHAVEVLLEPRGPQGPSGVAGAAGNDGNRGPQGVQGVQGVPGDVSNLDGGNF